jgi:hypothetical protein
LQPGSLLLLVWWLQQGWLPWLLLLLVVVVHGEQILLRPARQPAQLQAGTDAQQLKL